MGTGHSLLSWYWLGVSKERHLQLFTPCSSACAQLNSLWNHMSPFRGGIDSICEPMYCHIETLLLLFGRRLLCALMASQPEGMIGLSLEEIVAGRQWYRWGSVACKWGGIATPGDAALIERSLQEQPRCRYHAYYTTKTQSER